MNINIQSCHAVLEYDEARIFADMGHRVTGQFDVDSKQAPKLEGVTDRNTSPEPGDVIVLHQCEHFPQVMEKWLEAGHTTILRSFGQGCPRQWAEVDAVMRKYSHAWIASYSGSDSARYEDHERNVVIPFAKYPSDWQEHIGDWPVAYCACNAMYRRGEACGWDMLQEIRAGGVPVIHSGQESDLPKVGGIGEVSPAAVKNIMRHARCYLWFGTIPAPLTLGLIEAVMAGLPVVAHDNGKGAQQDVKGIDLNLGSQIMRSKAWQLLHSKELTKSYQMAQRQDADQWDVANVRPKWESLFQRIES